MNPDLNFILLTIMVTCAAFVGAANARGTNRTVVSYILSFICLAITSFYIAQYFVSASRERASQIAGEAGKILEDKLEEMEAKLDDDKEAQNQAEIDKYNDLAGALVYKMKQLSGRISNLNLEADTDEQYEA
ncbi:hypothetical protein ACFL5V_13930, partial [Fibrobacterota bacterium]